MKEMSSRMDHWSCEVMMPLWAAVGYFLYGGMHGAMAMIILCILCYISVLLNIMPIIGIIIQVVVMYFAIFPWVFGIAGISTTWLTGIIFLEYLIFGIIVNAETIQKKS